MAETDGTPRYRKSKPPKGAGSRNSRPSAKAKKRGAVRDTLPSGSTLDTGSDNHDKVTPVAGVDMPDLAQANSVVRTTMPKMIRAEEPRETEDVHRTSPRSTTPLAGGMPGPQPRTIRPSLGSTLRMELTVHKGDGSSEPHIELRSTAPLGHSGAPASSDLPNEPENPKRTRKPTTPGFAPAFPDPSATRPSRFNTNGVGGVGPAGGYVRFDETLRRGGDYEPPAPARSSSIPRSMATTSPSMSSGMAPGMSTTGAGDTQRPRRPRRPGERTLIMQRKVKTGSKRDWVFVVLLVAALGLTASMFLSQQTPAEEVVDAAAYDDPQEEGPDPFAPTTLKPWHERDKANGVPEQRQSDTSALTAREPSAAANSVQATELKSQPAGAEVLVGNAVVGSTPVRVARGSTDMVYVLRLPGHESKVVRVGPNSPPSILVQLGPLMPATGNVPAAPSGTP